MNPYQNPNRNDLLFRSTVDRRNTEINQNKTKPKVMASKSNEIKTRTTNPIKSFTENSVRQNHTPYNVDRDKTENFSKQ